MFRTEDLDPVFVVYTRKEAAVTVTRRAETRQIQTLEVKGLMMAVHLGWILPLNQKKYRKK